MASINRIKNGWHRPRVHDLIHMLELSLEQLYEGAVCPVTYQRRVICSACNGIGCIRESLQISCLLCDAKGYHKKMPKKILITCNDCDGIGWLMNNKDRCPRCRGHRTTSQMKTIDVNVMRGTADKHLIRIRGKGNERPDWETGDFVVTIQQKAHHLFERIDNDLHYSLTVSLKEALCGFKHSITNLDGRVIRFTTKPGQVMIPNTTKCIADRGMPVYNKPANRGNLYIKVDVQFPDNNFLSKDGLKELEEVLPQKREQMKIDLLDHNTEAVNLVDYNPDTNVDDNNNCDKNNDQANKAQYSNACCID